MTATAGSRRSRLTALTIRIAPYISHSQVIYRSQILPFIATGYRAPYSVPRFVPEAPKCWERMKLKPMKFCSDLEVIRGDDGAKARSVGRAD